MPLFSIADISFDSSSQFRPLNQVGRETGFGYQTYRYPIDIGAADKGHYMMFYINEQTKTSFSTVTSSEQPTVFTNRRESGVGTFGNTIETISNEVGQIGRDLVSKVKQLLPEESAAAFERGTNEVISFAEKNLAQPLNESTNISSISQFARTIRRTNKAIAIYMPDTLNFDQNQTYQDFSLGQNDLVRLAFAGLSAVDTYKKYGTNLKEFVKNLGPFVADKFLGNVGSGVLYGVVANPLIDIIYSSPELRTFRFDFNFYPRDEKEALEVQNIINSFRFHQAPEISSTGFGYFLVPPSEFDIKFFYNGRENPNIPKISTCVLQQVSVDYAPNGFSAYEVPGKTAPERGGTGTPVAVRLSLQFKETLYLTKEYYSSSSVDEVPNAPSIQPVTFPESTPPVTTINRSQDNVNGSISGGEVIGKTTSFGNT